MEELKNTLKNNWIPCVTYALIAVNVIVFIVEELSGGSENVQTALDFGAFYTPLVVMGRDYYRFVTSVFLHFGAEHLGANMISLFAIGPYVEHYFGHFFFFVLYIFSGISGNMANMLFEGISGVFSISAGASGAVFGLLSVFILFAFNPRLRRVFPIQRVLLSLFLCFGAGFSDPSVNFEAHLGGFVGGFIFAFIMQEILRFYARRAKR